MQNNAASDNVDVWIRINGQDVANSGVRLTVHDINTTDVIVNNGVFALKEGDKLEVRANVVCPGQRPRGKAEYARPNSNQVGTNAITPAVGPVVPAVIFSIYRI